jgi:hypothetical protein
MDEDEGAANVSKNITFYKNRRMLCGNGGMG